MRAASMLKIAVVLLVGAVAAGPSFAAVITHVPDDRVPPVVLSPPFGALAAGGEVGTAFIDFGVDYSYGIREGIFNDGNALAIGGVNAGGNVDLLAPVDGRIVLLSTTQPGLTDYLYVEAGIADVGNLLLQAFDLGGNLVGSVLNGLPLGPHNRTTMILDHTGTYDIASFVVTTSADDLFGVDQVGIDTPIAGNGIPEPSTLIIWSLLGGLAIAAGLRRRKQV